MIYEWHQHLKRRNKREKPRAAQRKSLPGLFTWPGAPSAAWSMPFHCGPYIAAARI